MNLFEHHKFEISRPIEPGTVPFITLSISGWRGTLRSLRDSVLTLTPRPPDEIVEQSSVWTRGSR